MPPTRAGFREARYHRPHDRPIRLTRSIPMSRSEGMDARQLLVRAAATCAAIEDHDLQEFVLQDLAVAQAMAGELITARETVASIAEAGNRAAAMSALATTCASMGELAEARSIVSAIEDDWLREEATIGIVEALARTGDRA